MNTPETLYYQLAARAHEALELGEDAHFLALLRRLASLTGEDRSRIAQLPQLGGISPMHDIGAFLALALENPDFSSALTPGQRQALDLLERALDSAIAPAVKVAAAHRPVAPPRDPIQPPVPVPPQGSPTFLERIRQKIDELVSTSIEDIPLGAMADAVDVESEISTPEGTVRWVPALHGNARIGLYHDSSRGRLVVYIQSPVEDILQSRYTFFRGDVPMEGDLSFVRVGPEEAQLDLDLEALGLSLSDFHRWRLESPVATLSFLVFHTKG